MFEKILSLFSRKKEDPVPAPNKRSCLIRLQTNCVRTAVEVEQRRTKIQAPRNN